MSGPANERLDELIVRMDERAALAQIRERLDAGDDPAALVEECRMGMERVGRLYEEGTVLHLRAHHGRGDHPRGHGTPHPPHRRHAQR